MELRTKCEDCSAKMGSSVSTGTTDPYMIATIVLAATTALLSIALVTVWCCCCRLQHQLSGHASYAASQYVTKEAPVIREVPHWGETPYGGGMDPSAHTGGSAYDWMENGQHHGNVMMTAPQPAVSNLYTPSPAPSCGPKKEFERVLLNPASTACTKPAASPGPVAVPSCSGESCSTAQFVLQSASNAY